jgi:hypothetical protein
MQVNKSNENYYLSNDAVIVDWWQEVFISQIMWLEVQHKQNFAVTVAGSGIKSAQRKRLYHGANKLPCINKGIDNAYQEVTIHKLGTSLTLLFKLP